MHKGSEVCCNVVRLICDRGISKQVTEGKAESIRLVLIAIHTALQKLKHVIRIS